MGRQAHNLVRIANFSSSPHQLYSECLGKVQYQCSEIIYRQR